MSTTTTMSPLLSSASLLNDSPSHFETSDELMLEELERRDGIYSFIFHELEAQKNDGIAEQPQMQMPTQNTHDSSVTEKINCKRNELNTNLQPIMTSTPASAPASAPVTAPVSASAPASLQTTTKSVSALSRTNTNSQLSSNKDFILLPTKNEFIRYQQYLKTWYPPLPPAAAASSLTAAAASSPTAAASSLKLLHASSIGGNSAASFYLDKRQPSLYPYEMNCSVSVRKQPPRFSHITTPLVRNRRHALKECDGYKQRCSTSSGGRNILAPDLRSLFPHDPDVHAPFIKSESAAAAFKMESSKKSEPPTCLPPCSKIKYEKSKI